jgi:hypothetical protein
LSTPTLTHTLSPHILLPHFLSHHVQPSWLLTFIAHSPLSNFVTHSLLSTFIVVDPHSPLSTFIVLTRRRLDFVYIVSPFTVPERLIDVLSSNKNTPQAVHEIFDDQKKKNNVLSAFLDIISRWFFLLKEIMLVLFIASWRRPSPPTSITPYCLMFWATMPRMGLIATTISHRLCLIICFGVLQKKLDLGRTLGFFYKLVQNWILPKRNTFLT